MQKWEYLRLIRLYAIKKDVLATMAAQGRPGGLDGEKEAKSWMSKRLWEDGIKTLDMALAEQTVEERLAELGQDGWELISVSARERVFSKINWWVGDSAARSISVHEYYFKRPLNE